MLARCHSLSICSVFICTRPNSRSVGFPLPWPDKGQGALVGRSSERGDLAGVANLSLQRLHSFTYYRNCPQSRISFSLSVHVKLLSREFSASRRSEGIFQQFVSSFQRECLSYQHHPQPSQSWKNEKAERPTLRQQRLRKPQPWAGLLSSMFGHCLLFHWKLPPLWWCRCCGEGGSSAHL